MKKKIKYYYTCLFNGGISYIIASSKKNAERQVKQSAFKNKYNYDLSSIKRISKKTYICAHK